MTNAKNEAKVTFSGLSITLPEVSFLEFLSEWSGIPVDRLREMGVGEVDYIDDDIVFTLESV